MVPFEVRVGVEWTMTVLAETREQAGDVALDVLRDEITRERLRPEGAVKPLVYRTKIRRKEAPWLTRPAASAGWCCPKRTSRYTLPTARRGCSTTWRISMAGEVSITEATLAELRARIERESAGSDTRLPLEVPVILALVGEVERLRDYLERCGAGRFWRVVEQIRAERDAAVVQVAMGQALYDAGQELFEATQAVQDDLTQHTIARLTKAIVQWSASRFRWDSVALDSHRVERNGDDVFLWHPATCLIEQQAGRACPVFDEMHAAWDRKGELATVHLSRMAYRYNPEMDATKQAGTGGVARG